MVVLTINIEGLLKDSEVVGVVGCRQQVLLLEVIDWSQATKLSVGVSCLENNSMFLYHLVELVANNDCCILSVFVLQHLNSFALYRGRLTDVKAKVFLVLFDEQIARYDKKNLLVFLNVESCQQQTNK